MLACALFAASSLSAASLVETKDPSRIEAAFPSAAAVRLVNVWATWCVPCVEEMADLRDLAKTFAPRVAIVGVSLDDMIPGDRSAIKRHVVEFLDARGVRYPNIYYSGSQDALADYLRFEGDMPTTIALDRHGKELWRHSGKIDRQKTADKLRELIRRNR